VKDVVINLTLTRRVLAQYFYVHHFTRLIRHFTRKTCGEPPRDYLPTRSR